MTVEPLPNRNDVDRAWDGVDAIVEAYVSGRLIDSRAIADAWKIQGPRPEYHRRAQDKLKRDWPTLYHAITGALTEENKDGT